MKKSYWKTCHIILFKHFFFLWRLRLNRGLSYKSKSHLAHGDKNIQKGRGCSTVVECTPPHDREVVGSNPAGCWAFFSSLSPQGKTHYFALSERMYIHQSNLLSAWLTCTCNGACLELSNLALHI